MKEKITFLQGKVNNKLFYYIIQLNSLYKRYYTDLKYFLIFIKLKKGCKNNDTTTNNVNTLL